MAVETSTGQPRWLRSWSYHAVYYAQTWRGSIATNVLVPDLLSLIARRGRRTPCLKTHGLVDGQTYLHFIAPSLIATTAMQLGEGESLWPVLAAVKWLRTYHAAAATPLEPEDILVGKLTWITTRAFAGSVIYTIIIACSVQLLPWWSLTLPFIGALITLAFGAPLVAYAAGAESDAAFTTLYRFAFVPMFLFSATFYPVSSYPGYLRPLVQLFPLYHGVALVRAAAYGQGAIPAQLVHVAVLVAMAVVAFGGVVVAFAHGWWTDADPRASHSWLSPITTRLRTKRSGLPLTVDHVDLGFLRTALLSALNRPRAQPPGGCPPVGGRFIPYAVFVAPGMLATSAMNGAMIDTIFNTFFRLKISHTYDAILATTLGRRRHRAR